MTSSSRHLLCTALLFTLVFSPAGCALERGDSDFDDQLFEDTFTAPDVPLTSIPLGEGPGAGTMAGTWLHIHEASTCVLGQEQVATAYYLVDFEQDGATLRERRRLCEIDLSPVLGMKPIVPREVLESIDFVEVDRGLISTLRPGGAYSSATEVGLWGVRLDEPLTDALPTEPDDPKVVDADGDGDPGVTLLMEGTDCRRYVVQRQIVRYTGRVTTPNQLDGQSVTATDTAVLGATSGLCRVSPPLEPNDSYSAFRLYRVDGAGGAFNADADGNGEISCEEISPFLEQAWPIREPDHGHCGR
ncbi:MAG: hypothetical protein ACNA8W_01990 [Bradymonadaceae bacterium]